MDWDIVGDFGLLLVFSAFGSRIYGVQYSRIQLSWDIMINQITFNRHIRWKLEAIRL